MRQRRLYIGIRGYRTRYAAVPRFSLRAVLTSRKLNTRGIHAYVAPSPQKNDVLNPCTSLPPSLRLTPKKQTNHKKYFFRE